MIPAEFDYQVADSVEHAVRLLSENEDAKLLAGGHSLIPLMKTRLARPSMLIDIGGLDQLRGVRRDGDTVVIGALSRQHDLQSDPVLTSDCAIVAKTAAQVGDPQVRHMSTIGGSVAHCDPASDMPAVLLALDARFVAQGPNGQRTIGATDFFQGFFESGLTPDEILTEIRVPALDGAGSAYVKFTRRAIDWAVVAVAAVVWSSGGTVREARIGLTNMGTVPVRARATEAALSGASGDGIAAAADLVDQGTDPPTDTFASGEYRRHLARVLTRRAIAEAMA